MEKGFPLEGKALVRQRFDTLKKDPGVRWNTGVSCNLYSFLVYGIDQLVNSAVLNGGQVDALHGVFLA